MSLVDIAPLDESHLPQVLAIEQGCFSSPWSENAFRTELERPEVSEWFVALEKDQVVGYAGLLQVGGEGHVTNLAVEREHRRRGIGEMLLGRLVEAARQRGIEGLALEVRKSNEAAIQLYEKHGFRVVGHRKRYYPEDDEDALIMWTWEL